MELNITGRVFAQVEQACAHFSAQACICRYHNAGRHQIQSNVHNIPPECLRAWAGHGSCHSQDQDVSLHLTSTFCFCLARSDCGAEMNASTVNPDTPYFNWPHACDQAQQADGQYYILVGLIRRLPFALRGLRLLLTNIDKTTYLYYIGFSSKHSNAPSFTVHLKYRIFISIHLV